MLGSDHLIFVPASSGSAGVSSFNTRTGAVTLTSADVTGSLGFTPYNATNPAGYQTAAQVAAAIPAASSTAPAMDGAAAVGTGTTWARADHVHPSDTSRAPLASPTFTGSPSLPTGTTAVTQTAATNNTSLATTAYVKSQNYAPLASPTFTGTVTIPAGASISGYLPLTGGTLTGALSGTTYTASGSVTAAVLTASVGASTNAVVNINKTTGSGGNLNLIQGYTNNVLRWSVDVGNDTAESGSNAGSDFRIRNFTDAGANIGTPLLITRSTGLVTTGGGLTVTGNATHNSGANFGTQFAPSTTDCSLHLALYGTGASTWGGLNVTNGQLNLVSGAALTVHFDASQIATFTKTIVNGPSDRTLKENVKPLDNALAKVRALQGVSFNWIDDEDKRGQIGLIAQDVEPIVPEILQTYATEHDSEGRAIGGKLALDYPKLTALLIEAIKTLAAKVEALEARAA